MTKNFSGVYWPPFDSQEINHLDLKELDNPLQPTSYKLNFSTGASMKKLLLSVLALTFSATTFAGVNLVCYSIDDIAGYSYGKGILEVECKDKDKNIFFMKFTGFGPGLEIAQSTGMVLSCPLVNKKKIIDGRPLKVVGAKASISAIGSLKLGLGLNERGALCTITGAGFGLGASGEVGEFVLTYKGNEKNGFVSYEF